MALTYVDADGAALQDTTATIDLSTLLTGVAEDDLIINAWVHATTGCVWTEPTTNGVYDPVQASPINTADRSMGTMTYNLQWRGAAATEAAETWNWNTLANQIVAYGFLAVRGADLVAPFRGVEITEYGTPTENWTAPEVTGAADGDLLVVIAAADQTGSAAPTWGVPAGMTQRFSSATGARPNILIATEALTGDMSGGRAGTLLISTSTVRLAVASIVIKGDNDPTPPASPTLGFTSGLHF